MKEQILKWLNLILMMDLFFVLFCFFWFVIALIGRANNIPLGFDLWYRLWEPVVQPALGILMAGALVSGAIAWVSKRLSSNNSLQ
ncbi:MAG: hypothetical protein VKJ24_11340 [Synechococcales bacterium]|nr:hypothetical protein [Synechococcales bacterium]